MAKKCRPSPVRPASQSWTEAKRHGNAAEEAVAAYYRQRGCDTLQMLGPHPSDLELRMRLEVKHDLKSQTSNKVAIEVSCNGKPSGLTTTTAHRWVIVAGAVGYMVRTEQLRDFISHENFSPVSAGDGLRSRVRLVPLLTLQTLDMFQKLDLSEWL